jgi:transposase-like protein
VSIEAVTAAARESEAAAARLRQTVAEAKRDGVSITDLAEAAGVTRQTIYRWLAMQGEVAGGGRPEAAIIAACTMLLSYLDPYQQQQVQARLNPSEPLQLLTALKMVRSWLPVGFALESTEEERMALGLASQAADRLISR